MLLVNNEHELHCFCCVLVCLHLHFLRVAFFLIALLRNGSGKSRKGSENEQAAELHCALRLGLSISWLGCVRLEDDRGMVSL